MHKQLKRMFSFVARTIRLMRWCASDAVYPHLVWQINELKVLAVIRVENPGAVLDSNVHISGWSTGTLRIAQGASIDRGTMIALGDEINGWGSLEIGSSTWIGPYNNIRLGGGAAIRIGRSCLISQFCSLIGSGHDTSNGTLIKEAKVDSRKLGIEIGDGCWLGVGTTVLPGVSIGAGAVIGANSVVTRDVGENEIWAGNPARKIRDR